MSAFARLSPHIREYIYREGWAELHEIQAKAVHAILDTDRHVLIASGTASGKTEAAFFPILSSLEQRPGNSVAVLYIGPLKALINDQFGRLEGLLKETHMQVWRWHGDVGQTHKQKLRRQPCGILQITPESLEAMLLRHPEDSRRFFEDLRYIVIDEVHAFMGTDRGSQLLCQIARIERRAQCTPRRIGLSATLGDFTLAAEWLRLGSGRDTIVLEDGHTKRTVALLADWFEQDTTPDAALQAAAYYNTLYDQCADTKSILFTNSRAEAESAVAHLRAIASERGEPDIFHVHHGSIAKILRTEAEQAMKHDEGPTVTAATLTLELGIDIGRLDKVIQIGAPHSCSSLVQRLGRSGRRGDQVARLYFTYLDELLSSDGALGEMPWTLLQMIGILQLYIQERWIEPPDRKPCAFSLLYHQTLGMLYANGEHAPGRLAQAVLTLPIFKDVSQEDFRLLLRHLIHIDHIQRTDEGTLIVGLAAEPIANHYTFYAVFPEDKAYDVVHDGKTVGTVNAVPPMHMNIMLAGRYWQVDDVEERRKRIYVRPAKGASAGLWRGGGGLVHTRVVERMREALLEDTEYAYLHERARSRLASARKAARDSGIATQPVLQVADTTVLFLPWAGTREMRTWEVLFAQPSIRAQLSATTCTPKGRYGFLLGTGLPAAQFMQRLATLMLPSPEELASWLDPATIPMVDKYDVYLPPELLAKQYVHNTLSLGEVAERILKIQSSDQR